MGKYIVKSGQNLFDVALSIYGSVEGVFDLLISNESQSLSFDTQLSPGQSLEYSDGYLIFKNVHDWLSDNNIKVANGDHIYEHISIKEHILDYISEYNKSVIMNASYMFPNVWDIENNVPIENSIKFKSLFANKILEGYFGFGTSEIEKFSYSTLGIAPEDSSIDQEAFFKNNITKKRMIIVQSGFLSSISFKLHKKTIISVDWGDLSQPETLIDNLNGHTFEHCFDDDGQHIISLYGNFTFETLDLSNVSGIYYPTSLIKVTKGFSSKLKDNEKINKLIVLENEQNT